MDDLSANVLFSYIVPTIGRTSLATAVQSILTQEFSGSEFEIIVVNDSGSPLLEKDWHASPRVRIINTNRSERSFARNAGAAVARGRYLAFLDDDDWILPGAFEHFRQLANRYPRAVWLYGGIRIVDEKGMTLKEINSCLNGNRFAQILGGAWAPIQSSMVEAQAFFQVGGFSPFIVGTEDEDLCRRITFRGEIANTPNTVACLFRGQAWNTSTNYLRAPQDTRYSRDLILSQPNVFERLISSANSRYWLGSILRAYICTIPWYLKKRRIFRALSRLFYSLAFFTRSLPYVFSSEYWQGVKADHVPQSQHFEIKEYEEKTSTARSATG